ncbi:39257_t:CDS:1, partial [Gigaspora margarita]
IRRNKTITQSLRQAVIAYADDTTWLASSNQQMQITLDIAEVFYKIMISTLTKLIIFNPRIKRESYEIIIARETVKAKEKDTLMRFLGIYFNSSLKKAILVKKAKQSHVK